MAEFKALSNKEIGRLLETAKQGGYYTLFFLALETGMRQGEIFGLQWPAIDLEGKHLWVRASLTHGEHRYAVLSAPKASRKRRIDLSSELVVLLREHRRGQHPLGSWVFSDKNGGPLTKDTFVRSVFHPLLKQARIERIRFHDLRHTSATLALSSGDNVKVVSERLGHSSAKMTVDVYAKAIPTLQRDSAARMNDLFSIYGLY